MNWNRGKNLMIFFLVLLNLLLIVLIILSSNDYTLSSAEIDNIDGVMAQNNVTMDCPMPTKFNPVSDLEANRATYNSDRLVEAFFGESNDVSRTDENGRQIFSKKSGNTSEVMAVDSETVSVSYDGIDTSNLSDEEIEKDISNFIKDNKDLFPDFIFDDLSIQGEDKFFYYRQKFKGDIIISNLLEVNIGDGTVKINYEYFEPNQDSKVKREIISPDEAIINFIYEDKKLFGGENIVVEKLDLVYVVDAQNSTSAGALSGVPCYRFKIDGHEEPLYINAFTGEGIMPT